MALYDHVDGEQRARVVIPRADDNRRHWNVLPESGRRGVALGTWRTHGALRSIARPLHRLHRCHGGPKTRVIKRLTNLHRGLYRLIKRLITME